MQKRELTLAEFESELIKFVRERQIKNPKLSARSIAFKLGVTSSTLQKLMSGKRRLGFRVAEEVASRMNVSLVKQKTKKRTRLRIKAWRLQLNPDSEVSVSWLNLAILEMIKLADFHGDVSWIAARLGLPEELVEQAVSDMQKEDMLRIDGELWIDLVKDASTEVPTPRSTAKIHKMQQDVWTLSKRQMETRPIEERVHSFSIMPVSERQIPILKRKIREFSWELCELAQNSKRPKSDIYGFQVGFFPMTQERK